MFRVPSMCQVLFLVLGDTSGNKLDKNSFFCVIYILVERYSKHNKEVKYIVCQKVIGARGKKSRAPWRNWEYDIGMGGDVKQADEEQVSLRGGHLHKDLSSSLCYFPRTKCLGYADITVSLVACPLGALCLLQPGMALQRPAAQMLYWDFPWPLYWI